MSQKSQLANGLKGKQEFATNQRTVVHSAWKSRRICSLTCMVLSCWSLFHMRPLMQTLMWVYWRGQEMCKKHWQSWKMCTINQTTQPHKMAFESERKLCRWSLHQIWANFPFIRECFNFCQTFKGISRLEQLWMVRKWVKRLSSDFGFLFYFQASWTCAPLPFKSPEKIAPSRSPWFDKLSSIKKKLSWTYQLICVT